MVMSVATMIIMIHVNIDIFIDIHIFINIFVHVYIFVDISIGVHILITFYTSTFSSFSTISFSFSL